MKLNPKNLLTRYPKLINLYRPFRGAGIRVKEVNFDRTRYVVELRLNRRNRNLFGTQFGGSLYAMTDPFYVFILLFNLGKGYIVWDKSAAINFIKSGVSKVTAVLEILPKRILKIKSEVDEIGKKTYHFETIILGENDIVVAKISKEIYIRKK